MIGQITALTTSRIRNPLTPYGIRTSPAAAPPRTDDDTHSGQHRTWPLSPATKTIQRASLRRHAFSSWNTKNHQTNMDGKLSFFALESQSPKAQLDELGNPVRRRQAHRKSKAGCANCKARKVKVGVLDLIPFSLSGGCRRVE
jgi:hypothetical protein